MRLRWEVKREDSKLYAFIVAILPCIMMYKVPLIEKGASTVIVLASAIILLINLHRIDINNILFLFPSLLYLLYVAFRSSGNWIEIILQISAFIHLYAICSNIMNISACKRYIKRISMIASICVIIQGLFHVMFNIHIPMIAYNLCLDELIGYRYKLITGMIEGIYRPSAFFLEPSHMAQYLLLGLAFCLLDEEKDYIKAIVISFGMVITTSGMGLAILICVWGWYYFLQIDSHKKDKINIILGGAIVAFVIISIAVSIPGVQKIIARIFGSFGNQTSDYNAINGRLFWWDTYFSDIKGMNLVLGNGLGTLPDDYFTGFMEILFAYGIIGLSLYYFMLLYYMHKSNNAISSCIILITGGLMLFANLTGFIQTILYLGVVIAVIKGHEGQKQTELLQGKTRKYIRQ